MTASVTRQEQPVGLLVTGCIDFANAEALVAEGQAILAQLPDAAGEWVCHLGGLTAGNSITAAVLLSWQRVARTLRHQLTVTAMPDRLQAILRASNLLPVFNPVK